MSIPFLPQNHSVMIRKADLLKTTKEQEEKLQLIYKYHPALQNIDEHIKVLQSMGLDERHITEVISTGRSYVANTITNPITRAEVAIYVLDVSIKKDNSSGQYAVHIGPFLYREFFTRDLMTKDKLEELSRNNPEVRAIYKENQKLKSLLASLHKRA